MELEDSYMAARHGRRLHKKGSLQDLILFGVILLFFGMVLLIGFKITSEINNQLQASDFITADGKDAANTLTNYYPTVLDNSFLFLAIGMSIVTLILASLVRIHPIFIPFFIIGLIIVIFVSGIFSNIYQEMAANTELTALADQLTFTSKILTFLPFIVGIIGTLLMIVLYKTWQENQI